MCSLCTCPSCRRAFGESLPERREALKFATWDSTIALMFALTINASILILAAATFNARDIQASKISARRTTCSRRCLDWRSRRRSLPIALLCCGINSTVTATMAGQIVIEGFSNFRIAPWLRRLITRGLAIIPAAGVTILYGEAQTGKLLILTQMVLSLQRPLAVVPLVMMTSSRGKMGSLVAPRWMTTVAVLVATLIIALDVKLVFDFLTGS